MINTKPIFTIRVLSDRLSYNIAFSHPIWKRIDRSSMQAQPKWITMFLSKNTYKLALCSALLSGCSSDTDQPLSEVDRANLDLREANVVSVQYDATQSQFDVTLIHADDDEAGYADWWQVESLDGSLLGKRELSHAHGNEAFTRSQIIAIPQGNDYVVVRGHDQIHGFGGQAIVLEISTGKQEKILQGGESVDFSDYPNVNTP